MTSGMASTEFDVPAFLGSTQLFRGLPTEQLIALEHIARYQRYQKGETIFIQGSEGIGFFLIKAGRVKVFQLSSDGKEQILHVFNARDHFAEVPALDGKSFPASAAAIAPTDVLFFPREDFLTLLQQQPALAINLLMSFARHLRRFSNLVEELSLKDVPQRLARYLLNLNPVATHDDLLMTVELDLTKTQLAASLGTIPATLSRVFYRLSCDGLIEIDGSRIMLLERDRLYQLSEGLDLESSK